MDDHHLATSEKSLKKTEYWGIFSMVSIHKIQERTLKLGIIYLVMVTTHKMQGWSCLKVPK
jgi:hypothetical protein